MRRRQLVEIEDQAWCPRVIRDGGTDWLGFMANATGMFAPVVPKIRAAMQATGTNHVVDLCSGGGGPWLTLEPELAKTGPVSVTLTDRYPNIKAFSDARARSGGRLGFRASSVDATDVPAELTGVRTMFLAFHHFPPDSAAAILADAVRKRCAIVVFEGVNHRAVGSIAIPLLLPLMLLLTPFVRPFRWSRLLFTYVLPLIPFLVLFDGTMSLLRLYLEDELRELVAGIPGHDSYVWDIGATRFAGTKIGLLHLIGIPKP